MPRRSRRDGKQLSVRNLLIAGLALVSLVLILLCFGEEDVTVASVEEFVPPTEAVVAVATPVEPQVEEAELLVAADAAVEAKEESLNAVEEKEEVVEEEAEVLPRTEEEVVEEAEVLAEEEETAPVTWTVYYWGNIMFRAAPLMLMLEDAGAEWEWQPPMNRPADSSFAVPTLTTSDGAVVGQAVAALAYAGKRLGYAADSDEDWATLDQAALDAADFISELSNPAEDMFECNFPTCTPGVSRAEMWFNYLEGRVSGPYLMGDDVKFADFEVFTALTLWSKMHGEKAVAMLEKYPKLTGLVEAVGNRENVAAFLEGKEAFAPIGMEDKPYAWAPQL